MVILDESLHFWAYLQNGIVAKQRAAHGGGVAVTADQLAALLTPASLLLRSLKAPMGCHGIGTRRQVAEWHPDGVWIVLHAATICHRMKLINN